MKEFRKSKHINFKYTKGKTDIYGRLFHDYYELYLLLEGDVEFTNNHTKQIIAPHQLVIIPPGEYHQFVVKGNMDTYERCVIDIYPEMMDRDILRTAFSGKEILSLTETDRIINNFAYLIACLSTVNEFDFSHILSAVTTDIIFLIKNNHDAQKLLGGTLSQLSLNVMNYIDAHFTEPLDLDMLSRKFFCSVSSLCHIFKRDFGISIKAYIIKKRINAASIAIQKGEKPEAVSIKYGFTNYSTFYRDYKKYLGTIPSNTNTQR